MHILYKREDLGLTTTTGNIADQWGKKDRTYAWRVTQNLIRKGLVERYENNFLRITKKGRPEK